MSVSVYCCRSRAHGGIACVASDQNPVDVIRELRCIQRCLSPAEVEALIADYEGVRLHE
ncbi:hypothetical protein [Streptomyces sp. 6N223]|uniref:hypothetical protein n=1 Tax=Streptomyces sp. 6N223 TaxID=3457412 RepID=UPI003FCF0A99